MTEAGPPTAAPACGSQMVGDTFDFESSSDSEAELRSTSKSRSVRTNAPIAAAASSSEDSEDDRRAPRASRASRRKAIGSQSNGARGENVRRIQTLQGTKYVSVNSAAPAPKSEWLEVEVQYYLSGSLDDLKAGRVEPVLKLSDNCMAVFDEDPEKRSDNHICGGLLITEVDSTFPATLQLDVRGLEAVQAVKCVTHTGSRGAYTISPKMKFSSDKGVQIAAANENMEQMTFLTEYPGWNLGNIDKGINYVEDPEQGEQAIIQNLHPIVAYFNRARERDGEPPISEEDYMPGTSLLMASADDTRRCLISLKKNMQSRLQIQNLYNVAFHLRRARGEPDPHEEGDDAVDAATCCEPSWTASEEVMDGLTGDSAEKHVMGVKNKLYLKAKFKYRTL